MITSPAFAGKKYAVLGLARSGAATVEALLASGAQVLAWDRQEELRTAFAGRCEIGDPLDHDLTGFEGVVVSPGVPLNTHPIKPHAEKFGVPVIGDIELFAQARADLPLHKVVGITGTNGKSTTTALVHHILKTAGVPATMAGNIGLPIMSQDPLAPNDKGVGVYVLELSSYQIDLTFSLDCDVAVLLNITPDHLDRYDSFEAYAASKARLLGLQANSGLGLFGCEDEPTNAIYQCERARRGEGRAACLDKLAIAPFQQDWPGLQGPHNLENAAAAIAAVIELGCDQAVWEPALRTFNGLPHRMERVAEHKGVLFINDSKATNPDSTAPALAAYLPAPEPRIHWIVGGLPKEDGLGPCANHLGNVAAAYTIGEAGPRFAELLEPHVQVERSELLCEAVKRAMENAKPGDVILLSPACASFDQFRDYEKRGEYFRHVVAALIGASDEIEGTHAQGNAA
jgi:UDP-N-acetylmuramoylalanine--D-glutamate ligase